MADVYSWKFDPPGDTSPALAPPPPRSTPALGRSSTGACIISTKCWHMDQSCSKCPKNPVSSALGFHFPPSELPKSVIPDVWE
eukprot:gene18440-biopygen6912